MRDRAVTEEAWRAAGPRARLWPQIRRRERSLHGLTLDLGLPRELAYFEGHFSGCPVLPGVVQIHWAALLFLREFGAELALARMEVIKFKRLLLPGMEVRLQLEYDSVRLRLAFCYRAAGRESSSGRLYWARP